MLENCIEKLGKQDVRRTKNREAILKALHEATGPLSPPDIVRACHNLGRQANKTTIYRELERMEKAGVVQKVMLSDRKQYFELSEQGHHHHLVCVKCEKIEDVSFQEAQFERQIQKLTFQKQFLILHHSLEIFGLCKTCK